MCGRYNVVSDAASLAALYQLAGTWNDDDFDLPTYNAAPTQSLRIVRRDALEAAHWGLVPFWAQDKKSAFKMINARCETITQKRSFKDAIARHRCLVPATGWYEWRREGEVKQPYLFEIDEVMSLAGIYAWNKTLNCFRSASSPRRPMRFPSRTTTECRWC